MTSFLRLRFCWRTRYSLRGLYIGLISFDWIDESIPVLRRPLHIGSCLSPHRSGASDPTDRDHFVHGHGTEALDRAGELHLTRRPTAHRHRPGVRRIRAGPVLEDSGPALPPDQSYGVEAVLLQVASQ